MTEQAVTETAAPAEPHIPTMAEFIATLDGAPSVEMILTWKSQAPINRIRAFAPDAMAGGKRAYILRGLSGLELSQIQKGIQSMATPTSDPELEMQIASIVRACLWTNVGQSGKLTDTILRTGAAGTPSTLFAIVTELSDFIDPKKIEMLSADL